jgi:hypothetical protein
MFIESPFPIILLYTIVFIIVGYGLRLHQDGVTFKDLYRILKNKIKR